MEAGRQDTADESLVALRQALGFREQREPPRSRERPSCADAHQPRNDLHPCILSRQQVRRHASHKGVPCPLEIGFPVHVILPEKASLVFGHCGCENVRDLQSLVSDQIPSLQDLLPVFGHCGADQGLSDT